MLLPCPRCDGSGLIDDTRSDHGCDGTDEDCNRTCPIPVPVQDSCAACSDGQVSVEQLANIGYSNFEIIRMVKDYEKSR